MSIASADNIKKFTAFLDRTRVFEANLIGDLIGKLNPEFIENTS